MIDRLALPGPHVVTGCPHHPHLAHRDSRATSLFTLDDLVIPDLVIPEPFSGSGSQIVAGETTGRRVFAIEISPQYIDVAVKRWQAATGKPAALEGSGRSFGELAAERLQAA
jgi:hypothetical protein